MPSAGLLASGAGSLDAFVAAEFVNGDYSRAIAESLGGDLAFPTSDFEHQSGVHTQLIANTLTPSSKSLAGLTGLTGARRITFGTTTFRGQSITWGKTVVGGKTFVWGHRGVRGRGARARRVVLGQDDSDTIIWGQDDNDTIIWGQDDSDTIIWGQDDTDTIIWGQRRQRHHHLGPTTTATPSSGATTTATPSSGVTTTATPSSGVTTTTTPSSGVTTTTTPSFGATLCLGPQPSSKWLRLNNLGDQNEPHYRLGLVRPINAGGYATSSSTTRIRPSLHLGRNSPGLLRSRKIRIPALRQSAGLSVVPPCRAHPDKRVGHGKTPVGSGIDFNFRGIRLYCDSSLWAGSRHSNGRAGRFSHLLLDRQASARIVSSSFQYGRASDFSLVRGGVILPHGAHSTACPGADDTQRHSSGAFCFSPGLLQSQQLAHHLRNLCRNPTSRAFDMARQLYLAFP